ncbi:uncharacterized protein N7515_003132 [Penicillium bovifimosum]|uniref:Uncharacterized protein n=1 Tax=Penicillium bovifimosum TaxID=126998 RepID=A0A9W9L5F5_9EURO|nr:uncharacterized protein N7515_003132 [Penicillium bovifimosum]KAJ5138284.1 hypothetical protein N7515_003132 [Penicillium bovifimosum]
MTFRDTVKRVFRSKNDGKPKVEYYRRHECPPSKFKGPFDRAHQKKLAAWSFGGAMIERTRSHELSLSPCATYAGYEGCTGPSDSDDSVSPDDEVDVDPVPVAQVAPAESSPRAADSGSQTSTMINASSYSGSTMTLWNDVSIYEIPEDSKESKYYFEESVRYTSPLPAMTPCVMSTRKHIPFAPEELARALVAVQLCA